jgi:hypothetical protein
LDGAQMTYNPCDLEIIFDRLKENSNRIKELEISCDYGFDIALLKQGIIEVREEIKKILITLDKIKIEGSTTPNAKT